MKKKSAIVLMVIGVIIIAMAIFMDVPSIVGSIGGVVFGFGMYYSLFYK